MELNKVFEMNVLLDIYGELLTDKQLSIMKLYYQEDISLSEISEELGISRQAVNDSLRKTEKKLYHFDSILNLKMLYNDLDKVKVFLEKFIEKKADTLEREDVSKLNRIVQICERGD